MQYVHLYLSANHKAPKEREQFIELLNTIWFGLYRRKVDNDSSGFEHVFLGEFKETEVIGLHNWIQLYFEEKRGNLDYLGFIKPKRNQGSMPTSHHQFINIQFEWKGLLKRESSSFIGTSPEFEFALYSLFFLMGIEEQVVTVGSYKVNIKTFSIRGAHGKLFIGSSFPCAAPLDEHESATKIQTQYRMKASNKKVENIRRTSGKH